MNYGIYSRSYSSPQRLLPRGSQNVGEPLYLNKSPGPDCIPPRIPKELMSYWVLSVLLNASFLGKSQRFSSQKRVNFSRAKIP